MKSLLVVALVLCVTTGLARKPGKPDKPGRPGKGKPGKPGKPGSGEPGREEKMPGVCLTMEEVMSICVGNTTVGIKLGVAVQTCTGKEHSFQS